MDLLNQRLENCELNSSDESLEYCGLLSPDESRLSRDEDIPVAAEREFEHAPG